MMPPAEFRAVLRELQNVSSRSPDPKTMSVEFAREKQRQAVRLALSKRCEGMAMYEPLPHAAVIHATNVTWRIVDGPNKGGKSLVASAEGAWALTDSHPHGFYPTTGRRVAMFVGLRWDHIGLMYQTMFEEGAFSIIPDEAPPHYWRAVRYDRNDPTRIQEYDLAYREKWKNAPPLVPPRLVKDNIGWEDRTKRQPKFIELTNGWICKFYSALGDPDQGTHYNFVLFDEEMPNGDFFEEAHRGLMPFAKESHQERPKAVWSATAQVMNPDLARLREMAVKDRISDVVREFAMPLDKNPYLTEAGKANFAAGLSAEAQLTRVKGIPPAVWSRVYTDYWRPDVLCCEPFEIPADWTLYFFTDPGRRHNCTIFVAVDPDEKHWTVYAGFDIPGSASDWARHMKRQQEDDGAAYECGAFDQQMGSERNVGDNNLRVAAQYFQAMREAGVQVRVQGSLGGFFPASNKVDDRELALKEAMSIRGSGPYEGLPTLQIFRGAFPDLEDQIKRAHTDPDRPDKRYVNPKIPMDWLTCLEYAAAFRPRYHTPQALASPDKISPARAYINQTISDMKRRRSMRERYAMARRY